MKQFCLAIIRDGQLERVLVKRPTIADPDDTKEAFGFAVDEYLEELAD